MFNVKRLADSMQKLGDKVAQVDRRLRVLEKLVRH